MLVYYNNSGNISVCFGDGFGDPDMIIKIESDVIQLCVGEDVTEFPRGKNIAISEEGNKVIVDFDASTPGVDGFEMELATMGDDVSEILIKQDGETVMEITDDGVRDKEEIADDEAVASGMKCKVGDQYFESLKEAFDSAEPGKAITIKMLDDEEGAGIGLFTADGDENLDITVDFDGHTYTASSPAVGSAKTETQALHLEMNNKVTLMNGAFTSDRNAADIKMLIQNYCDLTLDNMICDCADDASITYVVSNNFGNCLINNSEIKAHPSRVAVDCWFGLGKNYDSGLTVTLQDSDIDSTIEYGAQKAALNRAGNEEWWTKAVLTVNNCTFGSIVNSGQASEQEHHTIIVDGEEVGFIPAE